ncbi:MAG: DUF3267 domain-containing protein [Bacteroidales bacterium]|jgi:hypothetical protein|nr:DUF3267 domain-containing protein [Bacteroidales bacterium]
MALRIEDLEDETKYRQILKIPYEELVNFVFDYIRRNTGVMVFFWSSCMICLGIAVYVRINITGYYQLKYIISHTILGLIIFPLVSIPFHEALHIIPFFLTGARKIRIGMDLKQYIFYVTAHRHVITSGQFKMVALIPFICINIILLIMIWSLPGLWKWSLSLFLFVHTTMCIGDFALLNFYYINRKKKIYTWDDADLKESYFYEEIR